jgi:hypothetical protein
MDDSHGGTCPAFFRKKFSQSLNNCYNLDAAVLSELLDPVLLILCACTALASACHLCVAKLETCGYTQTPGIILQ